jgi:poly-gamma-glutamate capsule biosynthesis protein CapA/YwtB (metallophosphatase superfamily)
MNGKGKAIRHAFLPLLLFLLTAALILLTGKGQTSSSDLGQAGQGGEPSGSAGSAVSISGPSGAPSPEQVDEQTPEPPTAPAPTPSSTPAPTPIPAPEPVRITLAAIGDILLHQSVIDGGLQADGTYRYDHAFADTRALLSAADYTVANYEGTLNGPPYTGYPMFGGPDAIADSMREAGIDMAVTANNHAFDRRLPGLVRTPQVFAAAGLRTVGTRSTTEEPRFVVEDVGGIRVGFTAWTWETIGTETQRAINGIPLPKEAEALIDSFNPSRPARYAQDLDAMRVRLDEMREAGAECLVFIPHWGEEYTTTSSRQQRQMAQFLCEQGVHVVFGMHPHVLQEAEFLVSEKTGAGTLVFYSLGGFLSNMDYGTHGTNGHALDAIVAGAVVEKTPEGSVRVVEGSFTGTTIVREKSAGKVLHRVLPVLSALENPDAFGATALVPSLEAAKERIGRILGESLPGMGPETTR